MGVTFVTALYLPSGPLFKKIDNYFEWFDILAGSGIPLVVYLDYRLYDRGVAVCSKYPNIIKCIYGSLDNNQLPRDLNLPMIRNYEKDTRDYFCIQLSKLGLVANTASMVDSEYLAWIDFGIFHVVKNPSLVCECLRMIAKSSFPTDRILAAGSWPLGKYDLWNAVCWRFLGGFLLGASRLFKSAAERQQSLVMENLPGLTWEVNYWAMMEEYFINYPADHNDQIIVNVLRHSNKID